MKLKALLLAVLISFSWINAVSADAGDDAYDKKDYSEALKIWKSRADDGDAVAQHNVGHLYERGYGVLKDSKKGVAWIKKAAYGGYARSQYYMARHHINEALPSMGLAYSPSVSFNLDKAKFWVEKLYNNDDKTYKAQAEELWDKYELSKYSVPTYMKKQEEKSRTLFDKAWSLFE